MNEIFSLIPKDFLDFFIVTLLSLIIGLLQKKIHVVEPPQHEPTFGTDRTFALLGIMGYVFWIIDPTGIAYLVSFAVLSGLFCISYFHKIKIFHEFGFTSIITGIITYSFGPLIKTQPFWLFLLVYVTILILSELKETLNSFSQKVNREEFITLGKFLAIAGIILPMLPNKPVVSFLDITPYNIWLAVVVISSISYISYLLQKYVFKDSGILLTGILGGLYSSTATTIVLARNSKNSEQYSTQYSAGIILATAMMFLRIGILMLIFNMELFSKIWLWFLIMTFLCIAIAVALLYFKKKEVSVENVSVIAKSNPLEFRIAIIFTLLFVAFSFITYYTIQYFGSSGLQALAYIVGLVDIDPFLLNLFQGKFVVDSIVVGTATMQAILSNNIMKTVYGVSLANKTVRKNLLITMGIIIAANFIIIFLI